MNALLPFSRRGIYLIDALGSFGLGAVMAAFAGPLASAGGTVLSAGIVTGIGVFLIVWAGFNLWIGSRPELPAAAGALNVFGDALWVVASAALLVFAGAGFTQPAAIVVAVQAAGVGGIGLVKLTGLRTVARIA
jgi:hypothetical protein